MKKKIMTIALTGGLLLSVTACNGVGAAKGSTANQTVVSSNSITTSRSSSKGSSTASRTTSTGTS